jgi:hypothetical protein
VLVVALWLWAAWVVHSASSLKPPAIAWHSVPAGCLAVTLLVASAMRRLPIAAALTAAAASAALAEHSTFSKLREALPLVLDQTRRVPGPFEGVVAMTGALIVAAVFSALLRRRAGAWLALATVPLALTFVARQATRVSDEAEKRRATHAARMARSHTRDIGLALSAAKVTGVLFIDAPLAPPDTSQPHEAIFWSGLTTYGESTSSPRAAAAAEQGMPTYFLSPAAEPFERAIASPATAWLHAYRVGMPAPPPLPPAGLTGADIVSAAGQRVLGWANRPSTSRFDAWVLVVEPRDAPPHGVTIDFTRSNGVVESIRVEPEFNMTPRDRHTGKAWVSMPFIGPRRAEVSAAQIDGKAIQLP